MLYATTRGKHDVVTAYKASHSDCNSDGGLFVPFRMPQLTREQIEALSSIAPTQIIANVLNDFFAAKLTSWDVEYALGRRPIKTQAVGTRLFITQLWKNAGSDVSWAVQRLSERICRSEKAGPPSNWMEIAVRIALLFSAYGGLLASGSLHYPGLLDVALTTGDFAMPMAAWYARQMGLPVGNIVCGCNTNGSFWDLLNRGEFPSGDVITRTCTPEADLVVPRNLERLVSATLGLEENQRYLLCCRKGRNYILPEEAVDRLGRGLFAAVISDSRSAGIVSGVYQTCGYILGPYGALAYGALQDYRAMTGHTRTALLVEERSPLRDLQTVSPWLQLSDSELRRIINQ